MLINGSKFNTCRTRQNLKTLSTKKDNKRKFCLELTNQRWCKCAADAVDFYLKFERSLKLSLSKEKTRFNIVQWWWSSGPLSHHRQKRRFYLKLYHGWFSTGFACLWDKPRHSWKGWRHIWGGRARTAGVLLTLNNVGQVEVKVFQQNTFQNWYVSVVMTGLGHLCTKK